MKKTIVIVLTTIILLSLCSCGTSSSDKSGNSSLSKSNAKGSSTSNPYDSTDSFEIIAYKLKSNNYFTDEREVENKTKIKISNVKYQSDAPFSYAYNKDKTKDFCIITFDINVSESESKDMLNIGLDYLSIGAVDNLGTETRSLVSIDDEMIEKYNAQQKFEFLNIYPSSNTIKCITCVSVSEGSKLQLVHFVYYNENGEKCNIYVNPE